MASVSYNAQGTAAHVCNCIGCCRICGQCRTAPWHAATCGKIADPNEQRRAIIAGAMKR